ncbi:helix-turn-helix domain-containing protein [Hymenobacter metallicola]|uniref:Uncharacterized protein n=1 Tax=Hymenobacter metallicola TaxID=2563114 RepID=A0A4Z0PT43_9BACT|nr:hypothetical protein [Hymenobacter metallicola]TGE20900.1 hypothetical protein E5K02_25195 [Hymenobacter metallicola]
MSESSLNQRIRLLIAALRLSTRGFSTLLGVSDATVRNYVRLDTKPTAPFLTRMMEKVAGLSAEWLLTGQGPMFKNPAEDVLIVGQTTTQAAQQQAEQLDAHHHFYAIGLAHGQQACATLARENELLRSQLRDKQELIDLLRAQPQQ